MLSFAIPEETRLLIDTVRRFVEREVEPLEPLLERAGPIPFDILAPVRRKAQELGLFAAGMPQEVGGGGLSNVDLCLVEEQIGRVPNALSRRIFGQVYPMLMHCTPAQRERYLMRVMAGEAIVAMAITEPGAGSDAASIATTAVRDGDHWVINGRKHFISDGDIADFTVVMAVTDPERRAKGGISLFLVDKGTPGFTVGRVQEMMGGHGCGHAELSFDDCRVPADALLGDLGGGFALIMQSVSRVRLANVGARAVGLAGRVLEMSRVYANERVQFGKPIGEFQMIQKMIADMGTEIFAARMMVLNAAWELDQGRDVRTKVSMVKLFASEMIGRVADSGLQIFGGMGYTKDLPLERIYRDCRVMRIYDGTSEIHRMLIARHVLAHGATV